MATNIGWCWAGGLPELLVLEPERIKTPKIVNKEYNKRGIIDCPSYQGFYSNMFVLKSPIAFDVEPQDGTVRILLKKLMSKNYIVCLLYTVRKKCTTLKSQCFNLT